LQQLTFAAGVAVADAHAAEEAQAEENNAEIGAEAEAAKGDADESKEG